LYIVVLLCIGLDIHVYARVGHGPCAGRSVVTPQRAALQERLPAAREEDAMRLYISRLGEHVEERLRVRRVAYTRHNSASGLPPSLGWAVCYTRVTPSWQVCCPAAGHA
jgi:hypothetical protein